MPDEEIVQENPFIANGVTFDGKHSYSDFGLWLSERPDLGAPAAKTNIVEIPGADGVLDLTEANAGEVKFRNRTLRFVFSAMVKVADQEDFKAVIRNALHGRKIQQIILDEDPAWYYTGRASVNFTNLYPWKLKCVITVDAAPYAMKIDETVVDFGEPDEAAVNEIRLNATDVSKQSWNTDLRLGTIEFPGGLLAPSNIYLTWPDDPDRLSKNMMQVVDSNGNAFTTAYTTYDPTANPSIVNLSGIAQAGVDLTKVYRFLVAGIGGCYLYYEEYGFKYTVMNSRKAVVPVFDLDTQEASVTIVVNGKSYTILPGKTVNEDIVLKSGANEIYIPYSGVGPDDTFTMTFREGKL